MVSTDVKTIICWIKDDSKESISCSGSSASGFWSIYLSARGPSFFQPLLKLSPHALDCSLSMAFLKKVLPSFTLFRPKGALSVYKASPFLPVSQHLCLTNLPSRVKGLGPRLLGALAPLEQGWLWRSSALWTRKSCLSFLLPGKVA